ncbi:MAG: hypothetical protein QF365_01790 [Candidatus Thalassarchaeaceae archaeon]|nr:hypothetical protein [Candidatus Thalassarchaeaceae archaeon]DAC36630.1 MAG TPA: hypothetical protein D7H79_00720 [Candidatus Poseidoniales archaeon]HIH79726.1 hypothetical protein [Candidatus Thalassarchaeaceae archaeon]HJN70101.1 hypothetical protein [Candidatus Thalassarchaeaceae archaeon]
MVDVDSALRASAYSGKKRPKGGGGKEDKPSRKLEPFDPVAAYEKEKADAYSMWLVIILGLSVGLIMRYVLMPTLDGPETILWLIPVLLITTLPTIHKLVIPNKYSNLYDKGNWFRSGFLFFFTFIAISFILSNPPLADIAPPTLADGIDVADTEGIVESQWKGGTYTLELNQTEIDVILGLGIRDNVDAEGANMIVTVWKYGELEQSLANGTAIEQTQAQADFDAFNGTWLRGNKVAPHSQDIGMAFDLGTLSVNEYKIRIHLWEDGDPWDVNEWEREYTLKLVMSSTA